MKLLLIGDERKNRRMCSWGFSRESYRVRLANSRPMVDPALATESFHAVCIDLNMQEDNPAAILETLRSVAAKLPIIALVGAGDSKSFSSFRASRDAVCDRKPPCGAADARPHRFDWRGRGDHADHSAARRNGFARRKGSQPLHDYD